MSSQTSGGRYILFTPPALDAYRHLDGSLQQTIDSEIGKFLTAWNVDEIFDKTEGVVGQLKKQRSVVRAFATHCDFEDVHVLVVLVVYKKRQEDDAWGRMPFWQDSAEEWCQRLQERYEDGELLATLRRLRARDDARVLGLS